MTLSNGDKIMLVEVPEGNGHHHCVRYPKPTMDRSGQVTLWEVIDGARKLVKSIGTEKEYPSGIDVLGIFHKGEIDFAVKEGWVESGKWGDTIKYANYKWASDKLNGGFNTAKESFLSFLKSKQISTYKKYVVLLIKK